MKNLKKRVIELQDNSSKFLEKHDAERVEQRLADLTGIFEGYLESMRKKQPIK